MGDQDTHHRVSFASLSGKPVEVTFDGGVLTTDVGVMLLREAEARIGILHRMVAALTDHRHQSYVHHSMTDLVKQRVFQMACGYEDANDCNTLREDPGFKAACDRLPLSGADLASQPTMSRFENRISRTDLYRIARPLRKCLSPRMRNRLKPSCWISMTPKTRCMGLNSCRCSMRISMAIATSRCISMKARPAS